MRFYINAAIVHDLFNLKSGGIDNFADEWAKMPSGGAGQKRQSRSAKTIYSWLAQGMPKSEEIFFSFFGALDVDPIAVTDLEKSKFRKHFGRLRQAILLGGLNIGGYRPLLYFLRPSPQWPEDALIKKHYFKSWTTQEFVHDAKGVKNTNVTLRVAGHGSVPKDWPRAYHISYRSLPNADGLWRPFGTVIVRASEAILVQENGVIRTVETPYRSEHGIEFKTFFGPNPAEFRLASIHPFTARVDPYDDPDVALVFTG